MSDTYYLRIAEPEDARSIAEHRAKMFIEMGLLPLTDYDLFLNAVETSTQHLLQEGAYMGWFVGTDRTVVGGAGVYLYPLQPIPGCYRVGVWGHIANVYIDPSHRRRGLATRLMNEVLQWCNVRTVDRVTLSASEQGLSLYARLGFVRTSEMEFPLETLQKRHLVGITVIE